MRTTLNTRIAALAFITAVSLGGGCVVEVTPDGGGGGGGTVTEKLTVRVINASRVTLDPEIFATAAYIEPDGLFGVDNKFTRFGVGTLGLLGPDSSDTFTIDCANASTIGTRGGKFGDDLTAPNGSGQQVVLSMGNSVFCNGELTFTFSGSGTTFRTEFSVSR